MIKRDSSLNLLGLPQSFRRDQETPGLSSLGI
jgi:hypothetical protein